VHLLVRGELIVGGKDRQGEKVSKLLKELAPPTQERSPVPVQPLPLTAAPASIIQQAVSDAITAAPTLAARAYGSAMKVIEPRWRQMYMGLLGMLAGRTPDTHLSGGLIREALQQLCMEQLRVAL
jgi:hypothetical protein